MSPDPIFLRATLQGDDSTELVALAPLPPSFLEADTLYLPTPGETADAVGPPLKHFVTARRHVMAAPDGTPAHVHLRLRPDRPSRTERLLNGLASLPGDGTIFLAAILASLTTVGLALAAIFAATNPFPALGFMANHADAAAGWSVALILFRHAMRQNNAFLGGYFGFLWATAGAATWVAIGFIWPEAVSASAAADGYGPLGRRIFETRGETLAALAPWLPSIVIVVKAMGFGTASALIEKNLSPKRK